mmetsp:Transcript_41940/g.82362  ORF Transcript_41940/g.82362 Transcript_41940/m.82362 type:complete len:178 (+) Transcript_41940:210-743(+)
MWKTSQTASKNSSAGLTKVLTKVLTKRVECSCQTIPLLQSLSSGSLRTKDHNLRKTYNTLARMALDYLAATAIPAFFRPPSADDMPVPADTALVLYRTPARAPSGWRFEDGKDSEDDSDQGCNSPKNEYDYDPEDLSGETLTIEVLDDDEDEKAAIMAQNRRNRRNWQDTNMAQMQD